MTPYDLEIAEHHAARDATRTTRTANARLVLVELAQRIKDRDITYTEAEVMVRDALAELEGA